MTQHCPYDEKLLDYLYEEMSAEEAEAFRAHLGGCAQCQAALGRMQGVRRAFREIPPPAIEDDTLQRMTAQILEQAQPLPQPKSPVQTLGSTGNLPSAEVGKLLPFKRRGIKAVLFHPATGILAVAAMALLLVTVKGWQNEQLIPTASQPMAPQPTLSPAPGGPRAAASAAQAPPPASGEQEKAEAPQEEARDDAPAAEGRWREPVARPARPEDQPATDKVMLKAAKRARTAPGDEGWAGGPVGGTPQAKEASLGKKGEAGLPDADGALGGAAPASPRQEPVVERERGRKAVRDEASPAEPTAAPAAPPPEARPQDAPAPLPTVQWAPGYDNRQAPPEAQEASDALRQRLTSSQRNDLQEALSRRGAGAAAPADGPTQLLGQLRDHVRRGQCREASELQAQLERRFPAFAIPQEDRSSVARVCLPRANQQNQLDLEVATEQQQAPARRAKKRAAPAKPNKAASEAY